jgi:hypothetical protein
MSKKAQIISIKGKPGDVNWPCSWNYNLKNGIEHKKEACKTICKRNETYKQSRCCEGIVKEYKRGECKKFVNRQCGGSEGWF